MIYCGSVYGSKVWHSNDKYRRVIWQCNSKFKNEAKCATPHVDEKILKERFLRALSQYMADPEERIEGLRYVQKSMTDTDFIDADIEKAERDLERLSGMVRSCIMMNASANLSEEAYTQQYTDLTRQYEEKKAEYESLLERKKAMEATAMVFSGVLLRLTELEEIPIDFDEALWNTLIDHVAIYADERIVFSFMDGTEITEML